MFKAFKRKPYIIISLVLAMTCVLVLVAVTAWKSYAKGKPVRTIKSFLTENKIEYSDVSVDNGTLYVKIVSTEDKRLTLSDVKAVQAIYEAVHAQTIEGQIKNVGIEIYNAKGALICDELENDVSAPIENVAKLVELDDAQRAYMAAKDVLSYVEDIVSRFPYSVQQSKAVSATELSGKKLRLTLKEESDGVASINDLRTIYDNLELFALSTDKVSQCEITVNNSDGDCVLYMAGDYQFGDCVAWVSPDAEKSFLEQMAPPSESYWLNH